ncbi:MAG: CotH kinase family protein [Spirochaetia bacterium]|nr:CotH kinase family protein [Spirochaetia bacterium]
MRGRTTGTAVLLSVILILAAGCTTEPSQQAYEQLLAERNQQFAQAKLQPGQQLIINEVSLWNTTELQADDGTFPQWIELRNVTEEDLQLEGWRIVVTDRDGTVTRFLPFPSLTMEAGSIRLLAFVPQASRLPVSAIRFTEALPVTTAAVELVDAQQVTVDRFLIEETEVSSWEDPPPRDISYAREADHGRLIRRSTSPSPGMDNELGIPTPVFTVSSGFYDSLALEFSTEDLPADYEIRYTINDGYTRGEDIYDTRKLWKYPTQHEGQLYTGPVPLDATAVVKARVYTPTGACSRMIVRTYLIDESTELPIWSLTADPADLWSAEYGIYTAAESTDEPNFTKKGFRMVHTEFFDHDRQQSPSFSDTYLMRIFGNSSRYFLSKSLALYAKAPASQKRIPNRFFTGSAAHIDELYAVVLRTSGGDYERAMIRDGLMTGLATDHGLEKQDIRPSVVFLNGQYWGILNIREKVNEYFLEDHAGIDPDVVDLIEGSYFDEMVASEGSMAAVTELYEYITSADASYDVLYDRFAEMVDIENFIDYIIFQTFINNTDWPWSNMKMWRPQTPEGKWRFIFYDTDAGFDTTEYFTQSFPDPERFPKGRADHDMLHYLATDLRSDVISRLFKSLIRNRRFYDQFITRYTELLDTHLTPAYLTAEVSRHAAVIAQEIPRHAQRWSILDTYKDNQYYFSQEAWEQELSVLYEFARERTAHVREHLAAFAVEHEPVEQLRIANGDFEGEDLSMWNLRWSEENVRSEVVKDGDGHVGSIQIIKGMTYPWDSVSFVYDNIFLEEQTEIEFAFDMRSSSRLSSGEYVRVVLFQADTNERVFSLDVVPSLEWEREKIRVRYTGPLMFNGRLQFRVGTLKEGREILIDSITMTIVE